MTKAYSRILVTGGAGFIGSHLVDRLLAEEYEVTILDNLDTGNLTNVVGLANNRLQVVRGDIRNMGAVKRVVKDIDAIFHEAALASVVISIRNPLLTNDINVSGTLTLLKASLDLGIRRFVFASSAAVYGDSSPPKKREDMVTNPTSPYGVSKLASEHYLKSFYELNGLETVSLRYFNVYGPRQRIDREWAYGGVTTVFADRLLKDSPLEIYGDGEQTRDFVYVQDVVEANMLALEKSSAIGEVFNVGTGTGETINHVAVLLKEIAGKEHIKDVHLDPRPGDVRHGYADISKAKKLLGYSPKVSMKQGLTELLKWYTRHGHSSKRS